MLFLSNALPRRFLKALPLAACLLLGMLTVRTSVAQQPTVTVGTEGVVIDAGAAGQFTMEVPRLKMRTDDYEGQKGAVTVENPTHATTTYPDGTVVKTEVTAGHIRYTYGQPPANVFGLRFRMLIPIRFNADGQFALAENAYQSFPRALDKSFLYQGESSLFRLRDVSGDGFTIQAPGGWLEVADYRSYNWATFCYLYTYEFQAHSTQTSLEIEIGPLAPATTSAASEKKFLVDRFGQSVARTYSGKITSEQELKEDAAKDQSYLKSLTSAPRDVFGGMPGTGEKYALKKTGFFHLGKAGSHDVFVTPDGNAFFQLAVCSFDPYGDYTLVRGREKIYEWLPPKDGNYAAAWLPSANGAASFYAANWLRKYDSPLDADKWLTLATARLRKWGFNSSGAFSGRVDADRTATFPCTPMLPLETWMAPGLKPMQGIDRMIDPFADGFEKAVDAAFARSVKPQATNPNIIGYFLGNEQLFENVTKLVPTQKKDSASKRRLVQWLNEKYQGKIEKFNEAWAVKTPYKTFDELADSPLFATTPEAGKDLQQFLHLYLETYYSTVARLFRQHDPNHLLLGSRWQPGTANSELLVRTAAKYVDVITINYYTYALDADFLKRLHNWCDDKPMLLSEWHYTSGERGMAGLREVSSQKERGLAYRNYVETAATLPFIIGSQWFSYEDQPVTGRWFEGFNGEAANIGLVDVADRPYYDFVAECKKTNDEIYDVLFATRPPFHWDDPRFTLRTSGARKTLSIPRALPGMKLDATTQNWPGRPPETLTPRNLTIGTADTDFAASFRLCWDDQNLYLIAEIKDKTPLANTCNGADLWRGDGLEVFIGSENLTQPGALLPTDRQILLSAASSPQTYVCNANSQPSGIKLVTAKNATLDGYTIEAAIPWTALNIKPQPGKEYLFDLGIDNSDDGKNRTRQWIWNGSERNSSDRSYWGLFKLVN